MITRSDLLRVTTRLALVGGPGTYGVLGADGATIRGRIHIPGLTLETRGDAAVKFDDVGVDVRAVTERLRVCPVDELEVGLRRSELHVEAESYAFRVPTMDPAQVPMPATAREGGCTVIMTASALDVQLATVSHAMSGDTSRPHIAATLLDVVDGVLRATCTDGHRLSRCTSLEKQFPDAFRALIPAAGVKALRGLLRDGGDEATVALRLDGRRLIVTVLETTLSIALVDADFPPAEEIIPKNARHRAILERARLLEAIRAISICSGDRARAVRLAFKKGELEITGDGEAGGGRAVVPVQKASERLAVTVKVSGKFVAEALAATDDELVELSLNASMDPVVVHGGDGRFVGIVMPMRGDGEDV